MQQKVMDKIYKRPMFLFLDRCVLVQGKQTPVMQGNQNFIHPSMPNSNYPPPYMNGPPGNQSNNIPAGMKDPVQPMNSPNNNLQRGVITQPTAIMPAACPQPVSFNNQNTPNMNSSTTNEKYRQVRMWLCPLVRVSLAFCFWDIRDCCSIYYRKGILKTSHHHQMHHKSLLKTNWVKRCKQLYWKTCRWWIVHTKISSHNLSPLDSNENVGHIVASKHRSQEHNHKSLHHMESTHFFAVYFWP